MREFHAPNAREMEVLGERLGRLLQSGDVVGLTGPLGAGKTTLARGVARALGIEEHVQSPTYVGVIHYAEGRLPLWHADWYRVEREEDIEQLGLHDWLGRDGVVLVEWAERFSSVLPLEYLSIQIQDDGEGRRLVVEGRGPRGFGLEEAWA